MYAQPINYAIWTEKTSYCDKPGNKFWIQTVDDSQNELLSSSQSFRNFIMQNRLLLAKLHFLTSQTCFAHGCNVFYIRIKHFFARILAEELVQYTNGFTLKSFPCTDRALQTVDERKNKVLIQKANHISKMPFQTPTLLLHVAYGTSNSTCMVTLSPYPVICAAYI